MKKIIHFLFALAVMGITAKVQAQCSIAQSSVIVNIHSVTADLQGGCTTVFDLTYDIVGNSGNKWSHVHFWDANAYAGVVYGNGTGPDSLTLNGGVGRPFPLLTTISMDYHNNSGNCPTTIFSNVLSATYPPDPTHVHPQTTGGVSYTQLCLPTGNIRYTINNISVHSNNCNPLNLKADVWSAQDNNGKNIGCAITGLLVAADEPLLRGLILCQTPRKFTVSIATKTMPRAGVTFTAYRDLAPFGVFDAGDQLSIVSGPTVVVNPSDPSGTVYNTYGPYNLPGVPGDHYDIWIVATQVGILNSNNIFVSTSCAPLPVTFKSFTATRNHSNVLVKWETVSEQNSRGFAVERNVNGTWEEIAFVPSQAPGGNSDVLLTYTYTDLNNVKGISQYRVRQVDIDNKSKYSETRAVRGEGQIGKTIVYPNPTNDGRVTVVFEDGSSARNVSLMDMSGRTIKEWKAITNNNLQIENLNAGMYTLRIVIPETGEQAVEKIIVNKR